MPKTSSHKGPRTASKYDRQKEPGWNSIFAGWVMWVMKFQVQEVFRWPFLYFFEIEFKKKKVSKQKTNKTAQRKTELHANCKYLLAVRHLHADHTSNGHHIITAKHQNYYDYYFFLLCYYFRCGRNSYYSIVRKEEIGFDKITHIFLCKENTGDYKKGEKGGK